MPRYYFVIRSGDRELGDDDCTLLPRDAAAWDYALRIIGELKESGNYDDPGLQMIVKEEGGRQVFVIPFSEAGSFH